PSNGVALRTEQKTPPPPRLQCFHPAQRLQKRPHWRTALALRRRGPVFWGRGLLPPDEHTKTETKTRHSRHQNPHFSFDPALQIYRFKAMLRPFFILRQVALMITLLSLDVLAARGDRGLFAG